MKDPKTEAQRWWRQSLSDYSILSALIEFNKYDTCCFLSQQTAEKALKAYLYNEGEELLLTHSIFKLCDLAAQYNVKFSEIKHDVKSLDYYYVEARYPNAIDDVIPAEFYSHQDAEKAVKMASLVMDTIRKSSDLK